LPAGLFRELHHFRRIPFRVVFVGPGILPPRGLHCDAIALLSVTSGRFAHVRDCVNVFRL
jgi:hypothetical protein